MLLVTLKAVSYTHLDVYKRQGIGDLINNPNTYQNGGAADDLDADCGVASYVGNGDEAGMSVEFYGNVRLAGQKQGQHDEGDSTFVKKSKY